MDRSRPLYRWRFGPAEFDEARHELRLGGLPVELESKPLEVLAVLLRHSGEVVTKRELLDEIWRDRVTVEHVLATAVGKLRQALGPEGPELIVTVPRIGYRLHAEVRRTAVGEAHFSELALASGRPVPGREHFLLERPLGGSHASEVWLARHPRSGARRVFKFATSAERLGLLKREATVSRVLVESLGERPDIVRVLDWNFEDMPFFLECEYGGQSLTSWAAEGRLDEQPAAQRIALFLAVAGALDAAHGVGVLHKDIKPDNVLIDAHGAVRLTDFGSSRLLDPGRLKALGITALGMTVDIAADAQTGTPMYLAPELLDGQPATLRSDLYALGVLLYQLWVGDLRRPLTPGWERAVGDLELSEDIGRATDLSPVNRFGSVAEFVDRLSRLEERRAARVAARAEAERVAVSQAALLRMRARRPWVAAVMLSLVAGLVTALWLNREALRARADAEREAARAEAVSRFLNDDILGGANPGAAGFERDPTIRELLDRAADGLGERFAGDPVTEAGLSSGARSGISHDRRSPARCRAFPKRPTARYAEVLGASRACRQLLTRYSLVRSLAYSSTPESFERARSILEETDRLAGTRLEQDGEIAYPGRGGPRPVPIPAPGDRRGARGTRDRRSPAAACCIRSDVHAAAWIRGTLGDVLLRSGEPEAAEASARATAGRPDDDTAACRPWRDRGAKRSVLARALRSQGRYAEALGLAKSAAQSTRRCTASALTSRSSRWSLVASILDAAVIAMPPCICAPRGRPHAIGVRRAQPGRAHRARQPRLQGTVLRRPRGGLELLAAAESGLRRHFGEQQRRGAQLPLRAGERA
jgi:eukaryotic-like serine/threonine-protein kinase